MNNESLLTVVSVRGINPRSTPPSLIYIGRRCAGWSQSPLANPFKLVSEAQRAEAIDQYRRYLWAKMTSNDPAIMAELECIAHVVQSGLSVQLGCWCGPGKACHGDVVKAAVLWTIANKVAVSE